MVLEGYYGTSNDDQAVETIRRALDVGMTMIDSADAYGNGHNETLVGRAIKNRRNEAFIATKFGIVFDEKETGTDLQTGWGFSLKINGKPDYVRKALDGSLKRMELDVIDLWYAHYADPNTPIEETVGAMAEAVNMGKVRYLGLSNVTADQVRRAHAVHPITAVQYEYSLWRREVETALLPTLHELGIALVAWSPRQRVLDRNHQQSRQKRLSPEQPAFRRGKLSDEPRPIRTFNGYCEGVERCPGAVSAGVAPASGTRHCSNPRHPPS